MKDPRRWLIWVALAALLGMLAARSGGESVKSGPGLECLTHDDCGKALSCYAVPKDDPFATFGVCVEPCVDDLQCPAGMKCVATTKGKEQVLPVKGGDESGERVCVR